MSFIVSNFLMNYSLIFSNLQTIQLLWREKIGKIFKSSKLSFIFNDLLVATSKFLSCSTTHLSLTFLGIHIVENPQRKTTWDLVLSKLWSRINAWNENFISYGGRMVLLNSVLNLWSLFYIFFYIALKVVINEIIKNQCTFLWKGKKISLESIGWLGLQFVNLGKWCFGNCALPIV